jgi:hypothetical protein
MMIILQYASDAEHFQLLSGSTENSIAFFRRGWRDDPAHPISISGRKPAPKTVTEKTGRKKDETAFEIERCAHHRAERAGLRRDGDAGVSG